MDNQSYLVKDLAGCAVVNHDGEALGELVDVLPSKANDIFVVRKGESEILIPALKSVVNKIDLENRRIDVTLPKGLREAV